MERFLQKDQLLQHDYLQKNINELTISILLMEPVPSRGIVVLYCYSE